ncbi:acetyl-CoA carboxylase biotin carboxyl carrier protein [Geodermatophilus nigrescens]|uniref:Biotin carboxyl carrier protein of acetyl-CoA carboxylase n=1 Tax=Geodermatophilus nigrescens TaxID=1070870 RepID=A0A1M5QD34_9ACTN|nr:acetyl-CoA carboxylase biotin carboxyl carrier protein [Geodermatophilus nigrescens]SHH11977.1 acetyl-CoA carboxylase biotin carboxyl carrier protein [Geodermatophilus nigrescens]
MRPAELPPRADGGAGESRPLHEEVVDLARALPGPLRRLTVRSGDRAVEVEWAGTPAPAAAPAPAPQPGGLTAVAPAPADPGPEPEVPEGTVAVRAPLVGTFYAAPSPGAEPFVRVGDEVEAGQTLGIVEAMKLMNPILADAAGVVAEIRAGDAESVEYDQVLLLLRPPSGGAR